MPAVPPRRRRALLLVAVIALAVVAGRTLGDSPSVDRIGPPSRARALAAPSTTATTAPHPTATIGLATTTTLAPVTTTTTTVPFDVFSLRPPAPAGDPTGLASQIDAAEATLADPAADEPSVGAAALAQQVAYRQLALHPEWDAAIVAAVPAWLQPFMTKEVAARRHFLAMTDHLAPAAPTTWHIVAPAPLAQLQQDYLDAQQATGIPWPYLAAIHLVETSTGRIQATSVAGAQGPMQFLPATWARYGGGGNILDTRDAILGAARYLAANDGVRDLRGALFHYNHSVDYVEGVILYGDLIAEEPLALRALWHWGVWYRTASGDVYLPVGYGG